MGKSVIRYVFVGQVERGTATARRPRPGYRWHDAWSENGNTQPWLTRREAQKDAKGRGARAVFVRGDGGAS